VDHALYEFRGVAANRTNLDDAPAHSADSHPRRAGYPVVGVIRNPRSHRNRNHRPDMPGEVEAGGAGAPNVTIASPRGRTALSESLVSFADNGIELLVVDGGDGTVREVLTCGAPIFGTRWPRILVLPKGKTNALTVDLGMREHMSLAEALAAADRAQVVTRRPIAIDQPDGRQVLGFIMGAGVFNTAIEAAQVAHRFGAFQGLAVGLATGLAVVQALFGIGRTRWRHCAPMELRTGPEGRDVPHSARGDRDRRFAAGFSTLNKFPFRLRPFGKSGVGIRYVLLDAPLRRTVALMPFLLAGFDRPGLDRLGVHRGAADDIALRLGEGFVLDGEVFPGGDYRLRLGPELQFLVP
jgi:hypothetical protein